MPTACGGSRTRIMFLYVLANTAYIENETPRVHIKYKSYTWLTRPQHDVIHKHIFRSSLFAKNLKKCDTKMITTHQII